MSRSKARKQRIKEAKTWYPQQHFTKDSHVVKAYRLHFHVNKKCAMRELCMAHVLSPEREALHRAQLKKQEEN